MRMLMRKIANIVTPDQEHFNILFLPYNHLHVKKKNEDPASVPGLQQPAVPTVPHIASPTTHSIS